MILDKGWMAGLCLACGAGAGFADTELTVFGQQITLTEDGAGNAALAVDGVELLDDGVIYLDPDPVVVAGVTVLTGAAGAGGNACNAAPFVVALAEGQPPQLFGPVESCASLLPEVQGDRLLFISEASTNIAGRIRPDEVWVWTPSDGFGLGPAFGSADFGSTPAPGWEGLEALAGAHPSEAMKISPVIEALETGLGPDYPVFLERISELGAGSLTAEGYLGSACLKFTCDADWAILYLHRETEGVFAIWHVTGEVENHIWPLETTLWPPEAMELLRGSAGQ